MPLAASAPMRGFSSTIATPQFKVGSVSVTTLASSDRTTVTGVGFKPVALMVWTVANSSTEGSWITTGIRHSIGLGSTSFGGHSYYTSNHNVAGAAVADDNVSSGPVLTVFGTSTVTASIVSMDDDGFTLGWSGTTTGVSAIRIYYIAFGGYGSNFSVTNTTFPSSGADMVLSNNSFQPQGLFHLFGRSGKGVSVGAATAAAAQWGVGIHSTNAASPTNTIRTSDDDALYTTATGTASNEYEGRLTSLDANGFTIDQITNNGLAGGEVLMFSRMAGAKAGSFSKAVATGSQAVTGVGFQPRLVIFSTAGMANGDVGANHAMLSIGAATGSSAQVCSLIADEHNVATTDARAYQSSSRCILIGDNPGTIRAQAALTSMDTDGFTLNWSTNDANANAVNYLALA